MAEFDGFPREALRFLAELEDNNTREWFKANRSRYEEFLVGPAKALGADLAPTFGQLKLFRPYRDTRFHPGPPIKESFGMKIGDVYAGGGYVELSLDGLLIGSGIYMTAPDQVERWRKAVDDGRKAAPLIKAIAKAEAAGFALSDPDLKRVPRGYAPDHPRAELLKRKRFALFLRDPKPGKWLHSAECGTRIATALATTRPFTRWLETNVGPPEPRQAAAANRGRPGTPKE